MWNNGANSEKFFYQNLKFFFSFTAERHEQNEKLQALCKSLDSQEKEEELAALRSKETRRGTNTMPDMEELREQTLQMSIKVEFRDSQLQCYNIVGANLTGGC